VAHLWNAARMTRRKARCAATATAICSALLLLLTPTAAAQTVPYQDCLETPDIGQRLPIVLVHGFNSSQAAWPDRARSYLASPDSKFCIAVFDYETSATRWVTNEDIGARLGTMIVKLAEKSTRGGGGGRVVVLAHSMGGLATRCAASIDCAGVPNVAESIRAVITFGTPHFGTTLKGYGRSVPSGLVGHYLAISCKLSSDASGVGRGFCDNARAFGTSDATKALTPQSSELSRLPSFPSSIPVRSLAGTVKIRTAFWGVPSPWFSVGDIVVSEDSAHGENATVSGIGGSHAIDCGRIDLLLPVPSEFLCWHGTETKDNQFLSDALNTIAKIRSQDERRQVSPTVDLDKLWKKWQRLNDACRGGPPPGVDPVVDRQCRERDDVLRQHADISVQQFLAAWKRQDDAAMQEFIRRNDLPDAGTLLPPTLSPLQPRGEFDCTYGTDFEPMGCYVSTSGQPAELYFSWTVDYDKGWVIRAYGPDV